MIRASIASLLISVLVVGCGGSESEPSGEPTTQPPATTTTTAAGTTGLVGRWERVNACPELLEALDQAGLRAVAPSIVRDDYFPAASPKELTKKDNVCKGAEPFVHSHFFTDSGVFGSLTEDLEQVDEGTYEILDGGRFRIVNADVVFRYQIDGDELSLSPVITPEMKAEALADPLRVSDAARSIAVSYPGHVWKRVDCSGWC